MTTATFIQEEAMSQRPIGGRAVPRRQPEHLPTVGERPNVELRLMSALSEEHGCLGSELQSLRLEDGRTLGYAEGQMMRRVVPDPKEVQALSRRYGILRAQALGPAGTREFIEKPLGDA
ncbi:Scr1 family TA system antitoxin-like transcriptional regulator [Streptomyces sp. P6-2-1]|uniref:Scr1 family TA system antitoxin-like transcriptional regulator n=1 Tax=Streptomyces sp. P6-2-1 TaxID=3422591 RepID=UPI003D35C5A0